MAESKQTLFTAVASQQKRPVNLLQARVVQAALPAGGLSQDRKSVV